MMSSQTHTHIKGKQKKSCKNKIKPMSIIHVQSDIIYKLKCKNNKTK